MHIWLYYFPLLNWLIILYNLLGKFQASHMLGSLLLWHCSNLNFWHVPPPKFHISQSRHAKILYTHIYIQRACFCPPSSRVIDKSLHFHRHTLEAHFSLFRRHKYSLLWVSCNENSNITVARTEYIWGWTAGTLLFNSMRSDQGGSQNSPRATSSLSILDQSVTRGCFNNWRHFKLVFFKLWLSTYLVNREEGDL